MVATLGSGLYSAGEKHWLWTPKSPPPQSAGKRLVIACHGAGADAWQMGAENYCAHFVRPLLLDGFAYLSIDAGGQYAFGNDTAIARITDAWNWAKALPILSSWIKTDKPVLLGFSMGGLAVLNYLRLGSVAAQGAVVICPAVDLQAVHDGPAGYAAQIEAAYGGNQAGLTAALPTYSPYQAAVGGDIYADKPPVSMYYSTNDTAAVTSTQVAFAGRCPSISSISLGASGHSPVGVPSTGPLSIIRSFG